MPPPPARPESATGTACRGRWARSRYLDPALVQAECDEFLATLREVAPQGFTEAFMTAPSPGIIAAAMQQPALRYGGCVSRRARPRVAGGVRGDRRRAGFLLQIDAPDLAMERHLSYQDRPLSAFIDFADRVVAVINAALVNIPRDRVRLHACWGNYEGPHDCDVAMHDILPAIGRAKVGGWVLPIANPRHAHEYRCLNELPLDDGQVVVAGVIDPLTNFVEHPEVVADRLEQVARVIGDPTRVLAGTDCGFDTSAGRGRWRRTSSGPSWPPWPRARASPRAGSAWRGEGAAERHRRAGVAACWGWLLSIGPGPEGVFAAIGAGPDRGDECLLK